MLSPGWQKRSAENARSYKQLLKRVNFNKALRLLPDLHDEAFEKVDCLQCGNCCKGYSPRFKTPDIKRIAKKLGQKESRFIAQYLKLDQDGDYVMQSAPCAFLGDDNRCAIYEDRPSDCARFPYTDEDVFLKRQAITLKNVSFCPAAFVVIEGLMQAEKEGRC